MTEPARGGPPVRVGLERLPGGQGLPLPRASTAGSAGYDLCAAVTSDRVLAPGERALLPTGFAVAIPDGYEGQIRPRSGLALRHGIVLPNAPGTIDSDYRGELGVIVWNSASDPFTIRRGDRIAQLVIAPVVRVVWEERSRLDRTGRGGNGFGHSGLGPGEGAG